MNEKIQITRSSMPSLDEFIDEIRPLWESHWLTNMGDIHNELEIQLKNYLGVDNISLFSNGHMALELVIQALQLKGEVITTPFTFASTTHAIVRNGLTPVFCDINDIDYTIDVYKIEELITDKTSAIIPVHVYGNICNYNEIEKIAQKYNLKVIYDAAHAFGVKTKDIDVGNLGDASIFSFHATKVFNTIEGGAVCYKDPQIGKELYMLKNFGIVGKEEIAGVGANAKMNEFQAAMGICNLRHIDNEIEKRKIAYERYKTNLEKIDGIKLSELNENTTYNYGYFPIVIDEMKFKSTRDELYMRLLEKGIVTRKYFYPLTNEYECYQGKFNSGKTPMAKYIAERVLTLPLYADLRLKDIDEISSLIMEIYEGKTL